MLFLSKAFSVFQSISNRMVFIADKPLAQRLQICSLWCTPHTRTIFLVAPVAPCVPSWYAELCYEVMERLQLRGKQRKGDSRRTLQYSVNIRIEMEEANPKAQSLLLPVLESTRNHRVFANENTTEPRSESTCSLCSSGPNLASPRTFTAGASSFIPHLGSLE